MDGIVIVVGGEGIGVDVCFGIVIYFIIGVNDGFYDIFDGSVVVGDDV